MPSAGEPFEDAELLVFAGSHFCARASLGLLSAGVQVRLTTLAPGWHAAVLRRRAPQLRSTELPVLLHARGALQGSDAILDALALSCADPAAEQLLAADVGPLVRQLFYSCCRGHANNEQALRRGFYAPGRAGAIAWNLMRPVLYRRFKADREQTSELLARLDALCTQLDARVSALADSTLLGGASDRLGITAASLLGPLLLDVPVAFPGFIWPDTARSVLARWQSRPVFRLARMAHLNQPALAW